MNVGAAARPNHGHGWGWDWSWGWEPALGMRAWRGGGGGRESSWLGGRRGNPGGETRVWGEEQHRGLLGTSHEAPALGPSVSLTLWVLSPILPQFAQQPARPQHPH